MSRFPRLPSQESGYSNPKRWRSWSSPGQRILVDIAVFYDDFELVGGIGDQVDVLQRIAIDQKQVRECTLFHNTELARIRTSLSRQRQQFGVCRRRHDQRFSGSVPPGERSQNGSLLLGQGGGEQHIGAPRRLDVVLLRQLVGPGYAGPDLIRLGSLD